MNLSALGGILATVLGLIYTTQALMLPKASIGNPIAPKIFPIGIGILLILFGLILSFSEIKNTGLKKKDIEKDKNENIKLITYTSLACILYGLIFNRLGYVISTIIFLEIILLLFNGKEKIKTNTIVSICFSVIIYFLFSRFLGVTLPAMPFL
ncbi:putative tricarboxylic transport membrane protein [Paramaledivibacter caminithermalis DSM 15212]|uniref:Putative tricarboxylic transport membrane protein n=1 Tax=Paramaledivibacter caminithermalis (strain DSM 15212 / CIP 107654 / DViRD3) TaxID=1121301 RepID=A0A1M6PCN3_PARC5|nr:putative tricarboxylic transport membrane protein [Paramaledivibacter caminithermalis DSM 15212]